MNKSKIQTHKNRDGIKGALLLAAVLALIFWRSFLPGYVHFSNDGPLGAQATADVTLPGNFAGAWGDTNDIGSTGGAWPMNVSVLLRWILGAVGYSKFYAPIALFIMGLGVWTFFRNLKLTWLASILGTLAVVLNACFFGGACWGVASAEIAVGFDFLAMGLFLAVETEATATLRWARVALAGLCVGVNVMEAADIGVLSSVLVAGFMFFRSLLDANGSLCVKAVRGAGRVCVVAAFAGFIAYSTVISLLGTPGVASNSASAETPLQHWDWATQWSLPKMETIGIAVPGLFGYGPSTPLNMEPAVRDKYIGGLYWGGMARDPNIDRYFAGGGRDNPPPGNMRFGYAGYYAGILVVLGVFWALGQSFRRVNPVFSRQQKILVWFWAVVLVGSTLLAWGRYAPMFYGVLYQLPHFSSIRNPAKFFIFLSWGLAILFAFGIDALSRRYLDAAAKKAMKKWDAFDQKMIWGFAGFLAVSIIGWFCYSAHKQDLIHYLQKTGFGDENFAETIADFSIGQAGWFVFLLAGAVILLALVAGGFFSGPRAKLGAAVLVAFMLFDLGRADLPFVIHWDYKQKYEIGSLNPIEKILADKPYEHRVAKLMAPPLQTPGQFEPFDELYGIEWTQHHFLYYNIQCLDPIQSPRLAGNLAEYQGALRLGVKPTPDGQWQLDPATFYRLPRRWELSNTRYLLGPAAFLDSFNQGFDPGLNRFRIVQRFSLGYKPGVTEADYRRDPDLAEITAYPNDNGDYALYEFTGALPRLKLYGSWQVNTNDTANLSTLADANFDPAKTVLVSTPQDGLPAVSTNDNSGTVDFTDYSPRHITIAADVATPSVMLMNDQYDPHWAVTVDGKPAQLLRCNFIMRGVYLQPGRHTIQMDFSLPNKPLLVTLSAMCVGLLLCGWLLRCKLKSPAA